MRKNIIQSKTEPNKNDIWLSEEGLKKYGKNGWEPLGGGSNNSGGSNSGGGGPVIIELDASDFNSNGYNCSDTEIQAILNYNVLFKITNFPLDNINTIILRPCSYVDSNEGLIIGMFVEMSTDNIRMVFLLKDNKLTALG